MRRGVCLPLVHNRGGYNNSEALELLDGVIDIDMPDAKYGSSEIARRYSHVQDYAEVNQAALREMHRQVGESVLDDHGVAQRGLLVCHLLLPGDLTNTEEVLRFVAHEISPRTCVNVMDRYRPVYRADGHPEVDRPITRAGYRRALEVMCCYDLRHADERKARGA